MTRGNLLGLLGLAVLAAALSQLWLEARRLDRCAFDGARVQEAFAVDWRPEGPEESGLRFCSIECALRWRRLRPASKPPGRFVVRDEASGEPLAAEIALFLETPHAPAGRSHNFLRAFRRWQDALSTKQELHGQIVDNPFAASGGRGDSRASARDHHHHLGDGEETRR